MRKQPSGSVRVRRRVERWRERGVLRGIQVPGGNEAFLLGRRVCTQN
jgi:hypothetical protein